MDILDAFFSFGGLYNVGLAILFTLTMMRAPALKRGKFVVPPSWWAIFLLAAFVVIMIAACPDFASSDKGGYRNSFDLYSCGLKGFADRKNDWLFGLYTYVIAVTTHSSSFYFLLTAIFYVSGYYIFARRLDKHCGALFFLAAVCSLGFYSYGTNTLRAGLAFSVLLIGISFYPRKVPLVVLFFIATGIHASMLIPVSAFIIAHFYKNTKVIFLGWCVLLAISIVYGNATQEFLARLFENSEDDRMRSYALGETVLYEQGFRVDFLVYGFVPILVGLFYKYVHRFQDRFYDWVLNAYIIINGFWLLMIRAIYTDRFAYLCWGLIPIVLFFPLIRQRIFANQHVKIVIGILVLASVQLALWLRSLLGY